MPLDPVARALLDQMAATGGPALHEMSPAEGREFYANFIPLGGEPEAVAKVEDRNAGEVPVRIYTPEGTGPFPIVVFFHGGGWVIGDLDVHDPICRILTNASGAIVVAVHYRLAPEHKFPAAADDSYAATKWIAEHASEFNGDPNRIALCGDSAGGNLVAVVSLMARDRGGPRLIFQAMVYPVTDATFSTPSYVENADGYLLTKDSMVWFTNHYIETETDRKHPHLSPVHAEDLSNLPPALIITAEFDPLRDEGEALAAKLKAAGVPVTQTRYDGMIHGFFQMPAVLAQGRQAIEEVATALKAAFAR